MREGEGTGWIPYCGTAPDPAELLGRWNFDPVLLVALGLALAWYSAKGPRPERPYAFPAAIAVLGLLFVSPFCALTSALFAARAVHHAVLIAVVAPLIVWAWPDGVPDRKPPVASWTVVAGVTLWMWHLPPLYSAALSSDAIYWLMQASLLATACGFWLAVRRAGVGAAVIALLATMVQMGLLGALLTFSGRALYAPHLLSTQAWGFTPLEDQQLAGLIMWAPAAALYLAAALLIANRWLREAGQPAS